MSIYAPDEVVNVIADIFPARVTPLPPGVPSQQNLRVIITQRALTVLWQAVGGGEPPRVDIEMTEEQTAGANFRGGLVGTYMVEASGGCGCGVGRALKVFQPFSNNPINQTPRMSSRVGEIYGVPPTRFMRRR